MPDVLVSPDNFVRAESDLYFGNIVKDGGFGRSFYIRELTPIDHQLVIRANRDTLYSTAVFDLAAGPVTGTLPDTRGALGTKEDTDPVRHLIGAANAWG